MSDRPSFEHFSASVTSSETPPINPKLQKHRIRVLNDTFRTTLTGGRVVMTASIANLGAVAQHEILEKIQTFRDFTPDNDPHEEHDFGSIDHEGKAVFWKIDYYDLDLQYGSPNPADPSVTSRVLTVMFSEDY